MLFCVLGVVLLIWPAYGSTLPTSDLRGEPSDKSTFRLDYQFYPQADGWLKLHRIPATWYDARRSCFLEGARLASPINEGLSVVMRTLAQEEQLPTIHSGIHAEASVADYVSIEGVRLSQMPVMWVSGEPNNLDNKERCLTMTPQGNLADVDCEDGATRPYFCYKQKDGYTSMNECGFNSKQYQVEPVSGHCYKFHGEPRDWYEALTVCNAEGGTLAVINGETEAKFLANLAAQHNYKTWLFLGFSSWSRGNGPWVTVDGKTLKEAGYERWLKGEPNNLGGNEYCGSMTTNNNLPELNDINCAKKYAFICEISPLKH